MMTALALVAGKSLDSPETWNQWGAERARKRKLLHTSEGGQFLGFEIFRSRGEKKNLGRKKGKRRETRKEKNKFTATNFGRFCYRAGEKSVSFD